tara:strand:+ start:493 stop:777 length:285 start_codon:yes stop_codon:yes gene_type:complete
MQHKPLTVKDLIEALKQMDPETLVCEQTFDGIEVLRHAPLINEIVEIPNPNAASDETDYFDWEWNLDEHCLALDAVEAGVPYDQFPRHKVIVFG